VGHVPRGRKGFQLPTVAFFEQVDLIEASAGTVPEVEPRGGEVMSGGSRRGQGHFPPRGRLRHREGRDVTLLCTASGQVLDDLKGASRCSTLNGRRSSTREEARREPLPPDEFLGAGSKLVAGTRLPGFKPTSSPVVPLAGNKNRGGKAGGSIARRDGRSSA